MLPCDETTLQCPQAILEMHDYAQNAHNAQYAANCKLLCSSIWVLLVERVVVIVKQLLICVFIFD